MTIVFLSEDKFFRDVNFTLWGIPTFLTFTWVKLNVRPGVNTYPTHFLTLMNSVRHFLPYMAWYAVTSALTSFIFYQVTDKPKGIGFIEALKNPIYLKIILITPGIIWSLKFKTKKEWWNCGITNTHIKQNY